MSDEDSGLWKAAKEGFKAQGVPEAFMSLLAPMFTPATSINPMDIARFRKGESGKDLREESREGLAEKAGAEKGYMPKDIPEAIAYAGGGIFPYALGGEAIAGGLPKGIVDVGTRLARSAFKSGEMAVGTLFGGEAGGQIGEAVGGETGKKMGQYAGGFAGGIAGGHVSAATRVGLESLIKGTKLGSKLYGSMGKDDRNDLIRGVAAEEFQKALLTEPNFEAYMSQAANVEKNIPGLVLSLAARSGVDSVLDLKNYMESKSLEFARKGNEAAANNMKVLQDYIDQNFSGARSPLQTLASAELRDKAVALEQQEQQLMADLQAARSDLRANMSSAELGQKVRDISAALEAVHRDYSSLNYQDMYKAGQGLQIDMTKMSQWVDEVRNSDPELYTNLPSVFNNIKGGVARQMGNTSNPMRAETAGVEQVHSAWKALNEYIRNNPGTNAVNRRRLVKNLKDRMAEEFDNSGPQGQQVKSMLEKADEFHSNLVNTFRRGAAGEASYGADQFGLYTPGKDVVSLFMKKGGEGANSWKNAIQLSELDDVESRTMLRTGVLSMLGDALGASEKSFNPDTIRNFLRKHNDFISRFPELENEIKNYAKIGDDLAQRKADIKLQRHDQQNGLLSQVLNVGNDRIPQTLISYIENPVKFEQLKGWMARNPEVKASVLRHITGDVLQHLMKSKNMTPLEFVDSHQGMLRELFDGSAQKPMFQVGSSAFDNMRNVAEAYTVFQRGGGVETGVTRPSSTLDTERLVGVGIPGLLSRYRSAAEGRTGKLYQYADVLMRFVNKESKTEAEKMFQEAMYNPAMAEELRKTVNKLRGLDPKSAAGAAGKKVWEDFKSYSRQNGVVFSMWAGRQALDQALEDEE